MKKDTFSLRNTYAVKTFCQHLHRSGVLQGFSQAGNVGENADFQMLTGNSSVDIRFYIKGQNCIRCLMLQQSNILLQQSQILNRVLPLPARIHINQAASQLRQFLLKRKKAPHDQHFISQCHKLPNQFAPEVICIGCIIGKNSKRHLLYRAPS